MTLLSYNHEVVLYRTDYDRLQGNKGKKSLTWLNQSGIFLMIQLIQT